MLSGRRFLPRLRPRTENRNRADEFLQTSERDDTRRCTMASSTRHTTGTKLEPKSLRRALIELRHELLGKYRPERYYMRGPGPEIVVDGGKIAINIELGRHRR